MGCRGPARRLSLEPPAVKDHRSRDTRLLGAYLGIPVLSKDLLKEVLFDELSPGGVTSSAVARASITLMYRLAASMPLVILDSFFTRQASAADILQLDSPMVEVFCQVDPELARQRYGRRIGVNRHVVHDDVRGDLRFDKWIEIGSAPVALSPVRVVNTSLPDVDVAATGDWITRELRGAAQPGHS